MEVIKEKAATVFKSLAIACLTVGIYFGGIFLIKSAASQYLQDDNPKVNTGITAGSIGVSEAGIKALESAN